jgi:hypothetical protein
MFQKSPSDQEEAPLDDDFDDEAYLMVTQLHWEDDIIWNGEEVPYDHGHDSPSTFFESCHTTMATTAPQLSLSLAIRSWPRQPLNFL